MIKPESNLKNINPDFLENKYTIRLIWSGYSQKFIDKFIQLFYNLKNLDVGVFTDETISLDFVYNFNKLEGLVIPLFRNSDFILDCSKLPKSMYSLNLSVWSKKHIINIEALNNTNLQHLDLSDFDEKDLTKISSLTNLKSLNITRSKIKSLKGIENLINLEYLSLGAVRSLEDISVIVACKKLKRIDFDICWKLQDFSPIGELPNIEIVELNDCKNLASIKFVANLPNLKRLIALGTTIIQDFDTTPAKNVPIFFGSQRKEYNVHYPEKEIK